MIRFAAVSNRGINPSIRGNNCSEHFFCVPLHISPGGFKIGDLDLLQGGFRGVVAPGSLQDAYILRCGGQNKRHLRGVLRWLQ